MLSVSVSEQVKFKSKKCGPITVLPVTVEFGKFVGNDSHYNKQKRNYSSTNKTNRENSDYLSAPAELLHAVVALYHTYLPGYSLDLIYKTICKEGSRTLLLLRDGSEILSEWKNTELYQRKSNKTEINNNKGRQEDSFISPEETENSASLFDVKQGNERSNDTISPTTQLSSPEAMTTHDTLSPTTTATTTNDEGIDNASVISCDGYQSDNWTISSSLKNQRYRSINDILLEYNSHNGTNIWNENNSNSNDSNNNNNYNKIRSRPTSRNSENKEFSRYNSIHAITDVFADSDDEADHESMDEGEDEREDFIRGMESFLRAVAIRKNQIRDSNMSDTSANIGIEYRLIGCATFHKSYRSPGVKVVCIPFIAVRVKYRSCGIGRFLLKRLKRPSQVGPYDALVIQSDLSSTEFFRKNDFNDDIILNSRFKDAVIDDNGKELLPRSFAFGRRELMCYLPPFDGHYPPMPGTNEWNRPEVLSAIDDEIDIWRQKSLEAYQSQWTCITRLQQEIVKLRSLLKRQEYGIHKLRKENLNLQKMLLHSETQSTLALIDAWEKETANYG